MMSSRDHQAKQDTAAAGAARRALPHGTAVALEQPCDRKSRRVSKSKVCGHAKSSASEFWPTHPNVPVGVRGQIMHEAPKAALGFASQMSRDSRRALQLAPRPPRLAQKREGGSRAGGLRLLAAGVRARDGAARRMFVA